MIGIIFAFLAGVLFGGFCVYSSYRKKWEDARKTLKEIEVESIKHRAMIDTIRQFYGMDSTKEVVTND